MTETWIKTRTELGEREIFHGHAGTSFYNCYNSSRRIETLTPPCGAVKSRRKKFNDKVPRFISHWTCKINTHIRLRLPFHWCYNCKTISISPEGMAYEKMGNW